MLERLNVFLGGCGDKGAQDGDCIETLNQDRNALEKEGALAVIIGVFSDAPSQVAQEVHPCLVIIIIIIIIMQTKGGAGLAYVPQLPQSPSAKAQAECLVRSPLSV